MLRGHLSSPSVLQQIKPVTLKSSSPKGTPFDKRSLGEGFLDQLSANVVAGMKTRGIDVHTYRPTLIAVDQLTDADLIVSFACDAGRKLAPGKPEEHWDDCPAVSEDFDIAWAFITRRVGELVERIGSK